MPPPELVGVAGHLEVVVVTLGHGDLVRQANLLALAGLVCHLAFETYVAPSGIGWGAILALGLGPTGLAFFAWDFATKNGRLSMLGVLSYFAPLLSTVLLVLTGKAPASLAILLSALLIIGGAGLASSGSRREAR